MTLVPQMPDKVQYLLKYSFPIVRELCKKTARARFIGGRHGYDKEMLFCWLLVKKVTNWDYRTIASMAGLYHPTLMRANALFLQKKIYEKVLTDLIKRAYKSGLIQGK